ncbi:carbohydrate ABC transporter permease [Kineococcus sp. SYSU DK004]|uniref:carbohydrate ABC transporter permease n=1 Tax=Kineococcus sp. SYSU DK004 TaxID=3383125 RepID=UPI003D7E840B
MTATLTPGRLRKPPRPTATRPVERRWEKLAPYGYVAPFYVLFLIFGLFPLLFTFYVALFDWNPIGEQTFVGLQNFRDLANDPRFWNALRNTFSIWIISTVPQLLLALVLAQVLNSAFLRFASFFRMAMLLPYITSVAATTIVFAQLFNRDYGLLNWFLGFFGVENIDFMSTALGSHLLISAMVIWRWFGYNTLLYLASLQAVPRDLYEAAAVDGAGPVKQFFHITLPSLRPVIIFTVIMSTIGGLQIFTEPLLLSNGLLTCGTARQCQTLSLFLFEQGFGSFKFGYGSAIGVALFAIIVVVAFVNFVLSSRVGKKA